MVKSRKTVKLLLLQIRQEEQVRREELESFARFSQLETSQINILNVFDTPVFEPQIIDEYDALYVGGASGTSVLEPDKFPFLEHCLALLTYCVAINKPVFASCYGFQMAVIAFGGEIIRDEEVFEMGTPYISLAYGAEEDILFHDMPDPFPAISVHHEKAVVLPDCCELLAFSDICTHAFKVKGKLFWACQFHPEVDRAVICERLGIYKHIYTESDDHFREIIDGVVETPESNDLLKHFVDRVVLGEK